MRFEKIINLYIKWWWIVAFIWFSSAFFPMFNFLLDIGVSIETFRAIDRTFAFPIYALEPYLENTDLGPVGFIIYFIAYFGICFLLALVLRISKKLSGETKK